MVYPTAFAPRVFSGVVVRPIHSSVYRRSGQGPVPVHTCLLTVWTMKRAVVRRFAWEQAVATHRSVPMGTAVVQHDSNVKPFRPQRSRGHALNMSREPPSLMCLHARLMMHEAEAQAAPLHEDTVGDISCVGWLTLLPLPLHMVSCQVPRKSLSLSV